MKKFFVSACLAMGMCITGCAQTLPPHEGVNQAFKKSFEATGFNYTSKSKVTNISVSEKGAIADLSDKRKKYIGSSLEIIRGLAINADGAIDMKSKKSEVLYDLHYDKDNVEVSIKMPMLVDYNTQTVYIGTSALNTALEIVYPQFPSTKNGLIRINLEELLKENSTDNNELVKLLGENRFNAKNLDSLNNAFKDGSLKTLAKLNDTVFSEMPLTEQDKKTGIERRIHMTLDHKDSIALIQNLIDVISLSLFQNQIITKDEYAVMLTLTDKQKLDTIADQFTMGMLFDIGITPSGLVGYMDSQINLGDKEGFFKIGLNNIMSFSNYNQPRFSINPEQGKIIELKQILDAIKAEKAKEESVPATSSAQPEYSEESAEEAPGQ